MTKDIYLQLGMYFRSGLTVFTINYIHIFIFHGIPDAGEMLVEKYV